MRLKREEDILFGTGFYMVKSNAKFVFLFALAMSLATVSAFGQAVAGLGAISGSVRDASGSVVSGAVVKITNSSIGFNRTMQTTDAGIFAAPSVTPITGYKVEVEKAG